MQERPEISRLSFIGLGRSVVTGRLFRYHSPAAADVRTIRTIPITRSVYPYSIHNCITAIACAGSELRRRVRQDYHGGASPRRAAQFQSSIPVSLTRLNHGTSPTALTFVSLIVLGRHIHCRLQCWAESNRSSTLPGNWVIWPRTSRRWMEERRACMYVFSCRV